MAFFEVLNICLRGKQLGVDAVRRHQLGMGAPLNRLAVFEHHHLVSVFGVGHAMGDHNNRLAAGLCQFANCIQDQLFGFHVNAAGRLIEHKYRRIMQERAGDGDALALAAGQVGGIGLNRHVQSVRLCVHEGGNARLLERGPQMGVHGIRRIRNLVIGQGHQKILAQCARKQMAAGTNHSDGSSQCFA